MFRARATFWFRLRFAQTRSFCKNPNKTDDNGDKIESNLSSYHDAYKQLDKLDFTTAAKILFTDPPKKKKFGYHLTYFHAQYSNSCIGFHSFFFLVLFWFSVSDCWALWWFCFSWAFYRTSCFYVPVVHVVLILILWKRKCGFHKSGGVSSFQELKCCMLTCFSVLCQDRFSSGTALLCMHAFIGYSCPWD